MPRKKSMAGTPPPPANKVPLSEAEGIERARQAGIAHKRAKKPPSTRAAADAGRAVAAQILMPQITGPKRADGMPVGRPWQPGVSPNPGGQPKGMAEVRRAAREFTADAINALGEIMLDPWQSGAARVAAAGHLLDRGYGKVRNADEDVGDDDLELLSTSELDRYIIARATQLVKDKAGNYAPETKT